MAKTSSTSRTTEKRRARKITWQEKIEQSRPLTALEETKADADFNFRFQLKAKQEREAFEKLKSRGRVQEDVDRLNAEDAEDQGEGSDE